MQDKSLHQLVIPQPEYYFSNADEDHFFLWLTSIKAIKEIEGRTGSVILYLHNSFMDDNDLRELIALMFRYGLNMRCLQYQCNDINSVWLKDPKNYWYQSIFGD